MTKLNYNLIHGRLMPGIQIMFVHSNKTGICFVIFVKLGRYI